VRPKSLRARAVASSGRCRLISDKGAWSEKEAPTEVEAPKESEALRWCKEEAPMEAEAPRQRKEEVPRWKKRRGRASAEGGSNAEVEGCGVSPTVLLLVKEQTASCGGGLEDVLKRRKEVPTLELWIQRHYYCRKNLTTSQIDLATVACFIAIVL